MRLAFIIAIVFLLPCVSAQAQEPSFADVVVVHGHVWTVDPQHPRAEALAIHGGGIVAVSSDAEFANGIGPERKKINAKAKSVLPGFMEPTRHFGSAGAE